MNRRDLHVHSPMHSSTCSVPMTSQYNNVRTGVGHVHTPSGHGTLFRRLAGHSRSGMSIRHREKLVCKIGSMARDISRLRVLEKSEREKISWDVKSFRRSRKCPKILEIKNCEFWLRNHREKANASGTYINIKIINSKFYHVKKTVSLILISNIKTCSNADNHHCYDHKLGKKIPHPKNRYSPTCHHKLAFHQYIARWNIEIDSKSESILNCNLYIFLHYA